MNVIIPPDVLDQNLFTFPPQGIPVLQAQAKLQIGSGVARIHSICPTEYCVIFGESLSSPAKDSTVHVLVGVDNKKINRINANSLNIVLDELNKKRILGTQHPINFIITTDRLDKSKFDQLYAPLDDEWLKYFLYEQTERRTVDKRPYLRKIIKPADRKNQNIVPDIYKKKSDLNFGASVLNAAKKANQGTWPISLAQAKCIADNYNAELPKRKSPYKMLGNTQIMLYRPSKNKFLLLKGDVLINKAKCECGK